MYHTITNTYIMQINLYIVLVGPCRPTKAKGVAFIFFVGFILIFLVFLELSTIPCKLYLPCQFHYVCNWWYFSFCLYTYHDKEPTKALSHLCDALMQTNLPINKSNFMLTVEFKF